MGTQLPPKNSGHSSPTPNFRSMSAVAKRSPISDRPLLLSICMLSFRPSFSSPSRILAVLEILSGRMQKAPLRAWVGVDQSPTAKCLFVCETAKVRLYLGLTNTVIYTFTNALNGGHHRLANALGCKSFGCLIPSNISAKNNIIQIGQRCSFKSYCHNHIK